MPACVVVGAQWGDEAKGKIVDWMAKDADCVVRYGGGANAGHTVVADGRTFKLHHLPSGIIYGLPCYIGAGAVIEPETLLNELEVLRTAGINPGNLRISHRAHIVAPYHRLQDQLEEERLGDRKIGTTGRGIGPCYADKYARVGFQMLDLLDSVRLRERLSRVICLKNALFSTVYNQPPLDAASLEAQFLDWAGQLAPYVADVEVLVRQRLNEGERLLLEGAQGSMLDIDRGDYPYVTSSHSISGGACLGTGVSPRDITQICGVVKAYCTRVGQGEFPTELLNEQGDWLRERGKEFGTTTGRPRRCGWLDLVALKQAAQVNGFTMLAVTKLWVLSGLSSISVCTEYAPDPKYIELPGWNEDISEVRTWDELPQNAQKYVEFIQSFVQTPVKLISLGPKREQTVCLDHTFIEASAS